MGRRSGRQDSEDDSLDIVFANLSDKVRRFLRVYAGHALEECGQRRTAIRTIRKRLKRMKISNVFLRTGGTKAAIYVNKGNAAGTLGRRQFYRCGDLRICQARFSSAVRRQRVRQQAAIASGQRQSHRARSS